MPITNVVSRLGSTKREITTHIVEFYLSERDRPYRLYVNTATDAKGLVSELIDLAKVISRPTQRAQDGGWLCSFCQQPNVDEHSVCGYCGEDRPRQ